VTLIGRDGDERIDAEEAADRAGTIAYELVTRIPAHVPRRYEVPAVATASTS
jgi:alanine racemase